MDKEESKRLHLDWWEECRTCRFWSGDRNSIDAGNCTCQKSDLHGQVTFWGGYCPKWDSFDLDVALELLAEDYSKFP